MKVKNSNDKNFEFKSNLEQENLVWLDVFKEPFDLYGFNKEGLKNGEFLRIPKSYAEKISSSLADSAMLSSGGRVRFCTNSPYIAIKIKYNYAFECTAAKSVNATGGLDLYSLTDGKEKFVGVYVPPDNPFGDFEKSWGIQTKGMQNYTINFPSFASVKALYIGVKEGSDIIHGAKYINTLPVVFYGSSITHGACASRPGNTYEAFISQKYNIDYKNFGFAGHAKGEDLMAKFLAKEDMCAFVCDYDHNAPTAEHLQKTYPKMYEIIRKENPNIPYIIVTKPDFFVNKEADSIRRKVIYDFYLKANKTDKNIHFIDGETLFSGEHYESCTADGCHPNDLGFYRMSQVIGKKIAECIF